MKVRKFIYLTIGSVLILLNVLLDITNPDLPAGTTDAYTFGYFIGGHIFIVVGLIFLIAAYKLHKKIRQKKVNNFLRKEIDEIGIE